MVVSRNPRATPKPTLQQARYSRLIVEGMDQVDAWQIVYGPHKGTRKTGIQQASRIANSPAVKAEIARLKARAEVKTVLSLNDRLRILSKDAQLPGDEPAMVSARARVIEVYNRTAGDHAPDRQEVVVKGDPANPVVTTSRPMNKAEKIAALVAQRRTKAP